MKLLRSLSVLFLVIGFAGPPALADEGKAKLLTDSHKALKNYFSHKQWEGVKNMVGAAKAVVIAPNLFSGALIVGYEKGAALLLARHGEAWSDPVFVSLSMRSVGFQAGAKESEVLMMVLTRSAVDQIVQGLGRVGGTGGFALGSLGVGASGAGGLSGGMQILTVATSEGVALGSGLADMKVLPTEKLNRQAYGDDFDMKSVLGAEGGELKDAAELRSDLGAATKQSWEQ